MVEPNDLLDAINDVRKSDVGIPVTEPIVAKKEPSQSNLWLFVVIALIVGCFIGWSIQSIPHDRDDKKQEDRKQIVQPTKYDGATLVFVSEKQKRTVNEALVMRNAGAFCDTFKLAGYLDLDEEDATEYVDAAKDKGVQSPFVCIVTKDGKKAAFKPWPRVEDMGDLLK